MLREIISLIYPHVCLSCAAPLRKHDQHICVKCKISLPKTQFTTRVDNPALKLLWGKAQVEQASSAFYFRKGNRIQKLMHQLKYKGKEELGEELGMLMGDEIKKSELYKGIDFIIPVPLHKSRKRIRGYNQCDSLAVGLGKKLKIDVLNNVLLRNKANTSQTNKAHFERHENVDGLFGIKHPELLFNKKVLLIDDVITTGSTLASCARVLTEEGKAKVLVSTLAIAI